MSKGWSLLQRELDRLRRHFLPAPFNALGVYPDSARTQAHTRAFLLLSHAEIESYLETWAREVARAAEAIWTSKQRITPPLAFLLSWGDERLLLPDSLSGPGSKDSQQRLAELVTRLFPVYYKRIKENNGVKEKNVLGLFGPLGVPVGAFSATLLPNLDALGAIRGLHAHHSGKAVRSVLDPETEYQRVSTLLSDLTGFDRWLLDYRRRIR